MPHRSIAAAAALAAAQALAQPATTPLPDGNVSVVMRCRDCGVIHSVREVQRQRDAAPSNASSGQAADTAPANVGGGQPVGFVVYIPMGPGRDRDNSYVGSVGTREWQNRTTSTSYEYTIRMDDGEFRTGQRIGVSDLQVGDRVRLVDGRIERWGR